MNISVWYLLCGLLDLVCHASRVYASFQWYMLFNDLEQEKSDF